MNKDAAKSARTDTGAAPVIVDLRDRIPLMSDDELASLNANALRLKETGSNLQRNGASALLPAIQTELAERRAKKLANPPAKRASTAKKKKLAAVAEPDEEDES
jgi:hypothetical protein